MIRVLEFRTQYRTGKKPVDWVLLAPIGEDFERTQTWERVHRLKPDPDVDPQVRDSLAYMDMSAKWQIVGPAYEAWKGGQVIPDDGTPLEAWAGVTVDQAKVLKAMGVRTVEDVSRLGDAALEKLQFPNARKLPSLAKQWLEGEAVAAKDAKIAELEEKIAILAEMAEAKEEPKKRGPGRPRKTEAA